MDFLRGALNAVQTGLKNLGPQIKPFDVIEVPAAQIPRMQIVRQEYVLTLYTESQQLFACVLRSPSSPKLFGLFRLNNIDEAMVAFTEFAQKLIPLYHSYNDLIEKSTLQHCVDLMREQRGWNSAHYAAKLEFHGCFRSPHLVPFLAAADPVTAVTPVMVAVETGNLDIVQELVITGVPLNMADCHGNNVFHFAAKSGQPKIIQMLASKDISALNELNVYGESALLVACRENRADAVDALIRCGADPERTMGERYPIHSALLHDNVECVKKLIYWYKNQVFLKDKKYGGSPLHWANSREAVYLLAEAGAPLDARSNTGETPLHVMIRRARLQCAIGLLVQGADAALVASRGNNALHLAIELQNYEMVQALIVFGSDVNDMNEASFSPRHMIGQLDGKEGAELLYLVHRVGAKRCPLGVGGCKDGCAPTGIFNGKARDNKEVSPPVELKKALEDMVTETAMSSAMKRSSSTSLSWQPCLDGTDGSAAATPPPRDRVLCLDGGGIRGLVLIVLLLAIEKATGRPIKSLFDWIGGTSTGGILALGIGVGKPVRYLLGVYFRLKDAVFQGSRPYESEPLENFLKKEFGEHARMTDITAQKVLVTGVLADRNPADLHIFKNYETPGVCFDTLKQHAEYALPPRPHEQYIWRAARSSGAAPTYFRAFGRFLDGGLMSNNPTIDVLTEIQEYNTGLKATNRASELRPIHVVVSLGTGRLPVKSVNTCDLYRPGGILDVYNIYKNVVGAKNLGLLLVEAATQSEGRPVERARAWCGMIDVPFFRFSPKLNEDLPLDTTDDAALINMLWQCQCYISDHWAQFERLATLLI